MPVTIKNKNIEPVDKDLYRLLLEFEDYAIIMISTDGKVGTWNRGAEFLYGYAPGEIIGKPVKLLQCEEALSNTLAEYLSVALEHGRVEYETWNVRKGGAQFYANVIITVLLNEDNTVRGFVKVSRDLTSFKILEEENTLLKENLEEKVRQRTRELEIVNQELEAFSYSVSHDLRTPLRAISGYSMMLKEDYENQLDSEANRIINNIINNTAMMGQLIDDLLTFSKMARLEAAHSFIGMKRLAQQCITELLQGEKQPTSCIKVLDLPECNGDANMLKQVWQNLLGNAIKYSSKKEKPNIEVGAVDDKKNHIYYVKDEGAGFDMKYANKLFGVFQRLHRQDEFEGTGLGLALVKRIVSKHGGEIWAEAKKDCGATFYFSIPKIFNCER